MIKNDYHHGNLKEEFLRIAFDYIAENDVENLTLKILSDATGTSRSAIYRHFSSKDKLIETMIIKGFEEFDASVSPILRETSKPLIDRFYVSGKSYLEFAKQNSNLYRLLFGKRHANIRENIMSITNEECSGFSALKLAIEEGQKSGALKKEDSFQRTILIWSSLHGLASLIIDGFMDVDKIDTELYDKMFQDMLAASLSNKVKILSSIPFVENILKPNF
ncbi:TetR/AcrR family transcriptional regulator [bacterium]|jgi:AcrR family transcriptional regulator|nr:TetR/AcrR family transcriptional regulator [bacterium]MBU1435197.1 TetR/AcrR family transcriptional regulator [bacterium]MBU1502854.1 TetR/AcrR family transcriptional regulator [bacterium]